MVHAYILIQTEVGKAASVASAIAALDGVTSAEGVTGPYDVIVRAEATNVDELGRAGHGQGAGRRRHHAHRQLHGGPPLSRTKRWLLLFVAVLVVAAGSGLIVGLLRRSEPVRVTNVPTPTAAEAAACRRLAGLLPSTIGDGLKKRVVHPSSPLLHAWALRRPCCGAGSAIHRLPVGGRSSRGRRHHLGRAPWPAVR